MTHNVPHTFKVKGSHLKVTAWHNLFTAIQRYKSGTVSLTVQTSVKIILEPSAIRDTSSRSLGQILKCNNSAADCSIALKFCT